MAKTAKENGHKWLWLLVCAGLAYAAYTYQEPLLQWADPYLQQTGLPLDFLRPDEVVAGENDANEQDTESGGAPTAHHSSDANTATAPTQAAADHEPVPATPTPQYQYILKSVALDPFELKIEINAATVQERVYGDQKQVEEVDITEILRTRDRHILSVNTRRVQKEKTDTTWGKALGTNSFKVWIERRPTGTYYGEKLVEIKGPGRLKPFGEWARLAKSFSMALPKMAANGTSNGAGAANATDGSGAEAAPEKKSVITFTRSESQRPVEYKNPSWLFGRWKVVPDTNKNSSKPWGLQFGPKHLQVSQNGRTETFEYRSWPQSNQTLLLEAFQGPVVKKYRVETTATYWRLTTPEGRTFRMVRDQF